MFLEKEDNTNKIVKVEDDKTHVEATNKQAAASPPVKSDGMIHITKLIHFKS